ncbi:MAG: lipoprotein [Pseudomonadota bacterium]
MLHSNISSQTKILIVKSTPALFIGTILCLSALLSGCGQPGPLYLPKAPAKPATSAEPGKAAAAPAPAPAPSTAPQH